MWLLYISSKHMTNDIKNLERKTYVSVLVDVMENNSWDFSVQLFVVRLSVRFYGLGDVFVP